MSRPRSSDEFRHPGVDPLPRCPHCHGELPGFHVLPWYTTTQLARLWQVSRHHVRWILRAAQAAGLPLVIRRQWKSRTRLNRHLIRGDSAQAVAAWRWPGAVSVVKVRMKTRGV